MFLLRYSLSRLLNSTFPAFAASRALGSDSGARTNQQSIHLFIYCAKTIIYDVKRGVIGCSILYFCMRSGFHHMHHLSGVSQFDSLKRLRNVASFFASKSIRNATQISIEK